jgi:hypothetical protein
MDAGIYGSQKNTGASRSTRGKESCATEGVPSVAGVVAQDLSCEVWIVFGRMIVVLDGVAVLSGIAVSEEVKRRQAEAYPTGGGDALRNIF